MGFGGLVGDRFAYLTIRTHIPNGNGVDGARNAAATNTHRPHPTDPLSAGTTEATQTQPAGGQKANRAKEKERRSETPKRPKLKSRCALSLLF